METIIVGEVVKPQGVQGELKVYPLTDDPARFKQLETVILCEGTKTNKFQINSARVDGKGMVFLSLDGITSREEAEKYRGFTVKVERSQVPPLTDRWYYFELEGMQVYENEVLLGELTKVLATGANDVYIVTDKDSQKEILIPALKSVVQKVDVAARRMDVLLPPGLLD